MKKNKFWRSFRLGEISQAWTWSKERIATIWWSYLDPYFWTVFLPLAGVTAGFLLPFRVPEMLVEAPTLGWLSLGLWIFVSGAGSVLLEERLYLPVGTLPAAIVFGVTALMVCRLGLVALGIGDQVGFWAFVGLLAAFSLLFFIITLVIYRDVFRKFFTETVPRFLREWGLTVLGLSIALYLSWWLPEPLFNQPNSAPLLLIIYPLILGWFAGGLNDHVPQADGNLSMAVISVFCAVFGFRLSAVSGNPAWIPNLGLIAVSILFTVKTIVSLRDQ